MEHLIQYTWKVKTAFNDYLYRSLSMDDMVEILRNVEQHAKRDLPTEQRSKVSLWFKFFPGDTGATTISDIKKALQYPSHPNYQYMRVSMGMALGNNDELQIHLS